LRNTGRGDPCEGILETPGEAASSQYRGRTCRRPTEAGAAGLRTAAGSCCASSTTPQIRKPTADPGGVRVVIAERLGKLARMTVKDLKAEYKTLFGRPAQTSNRQRLLRRIALEIQAQVEGRQPEQVRQHACAIAEREKLCRRVAENIEKRPAAQRRR